MTCRWILVTGLECKESSSSSLSFSSSKGKTEDENEREDEDEERNRNMNQLAIRRGTDNTLLLDGNGSWTPVQVRRCFPWQEPHRYLALCDEDGRELALVRGLEDIDDQSRAHLEEELALAGFTLAIERIVSIEKEIEIRNWHVVIGGQERRFQTELDEWPRALPDDTYLIKDVAGDLYSVCKASELDATSRKELWALIG